MFSHCVDSFRFELGLPQGLSILVLCVAWMGTQESRAQNSSFLPDAGQGQEITQTASLDSRAAGTAKLQSTQAEFVTRGGLGLSGVANGSSNIADVDADGNLDILLTGRGTAVLYLGQGDGTFQPAGANLSGVSGSSSSIADVNGDTHLDLLITGSTRQGGTLVYLGNGDGTFQQKQTPGLPASQRGSIDVADVVGDASPDVLLTGIDASDELSAALYTGNGDGTFTESSVQLTGVYQSDASIADITGDGTTDLLIAGFSPQGPKTFLYEGDGAGGFSELSHAFIGVRKASVTVTDATGDESLNVLLSGEPRSGPVRSVLYGRDGSGGFTVVNGNLPPIRNGSSSVGDVNGDGNPDLLFAGYPSTQLMMGEGTGGFGPADAGLTGVGAASSNIADISGDGDPDLLLTGVDAFGNSSTRLYVHRRTQQPTNHDPRLVNGLGQNTDVAPGLSISRTIEVGDPDGDKLSFSLSQGESVSTASLTDAGNGVAELTFAPSQAQAGKTVSVTVEAGQQDGSGGTVQSTVTFQVTQEFFAQRGRLDPFRDGDMAVGDVNNDGLLDIVASGFGVQGPMTAVYLGQGQSTYRKAGAGLTGVFDSSVSVADVDDDGNLDILVAGDGRSAGLTSALYLGNGDGSFEQANANLTGVTNGSTSIADVNGDHHLDLFITGITYSGQGLLSTLYLGNGDGTFETARADLADVSHGASSFTDVNGDQNLDLLLTGNDGQSELSILYLGEGDGTFTEAGAQLTGVTGSSAGTADFNGDGTPDLLLAGHSGQQGKISTLYLGNGDGTFTEAGAQLDGVAGGGLAISEANGDQHLDILITGRRGKPTSTLYLGNGDGTFSRAEAGLLGVQNGVVGVGDVGGDRDLDLFVAGIDVENRPSVRFYEALGAGPKPTVSESQSVNTDGSADFSESGTQIDFSGMSGTGEVTIETYDETPADAGGLSDQDPRGKALVIEAGGEFDFTSAQIKMATSTFGEIGDPTEVALYKRGTPGTGRFRPLPTRVDTNGTATAEDDTLYARAKGFSEFMVADGFSYPRTVSAVASRSFNGAVDSTGYRLVALPGRVHRPLEDAVNGEAGVDWQAYRVGSDSENPLVKYDGSDDFVLTPGTGFWLTAKKKWTLEESLSTVALSGDSAAKIGVRQGWNVISNPTGEDISWSRVESETKGTLQPLWGFDGTFSQASTFQSARAGVAYYFYNDVSGRDSLVIPYPGAPGGISTPLKSAGEKSALFALTAAPAGVEGAAGSTVRLGLSEEATEGLGPDDQVAPPRQFSITSLRLQPPTTKEEDGPPTPLLMAERRPPSDGQTFEVQLRTKANGTVRLAARNLEAVDGQSVVLLHPEGGTTYDLGTQSGVRIHPSDSTTTLKVAVGSESYVDRQRGEVVPDDVRLTTYPNPLRRHGTVEYALPDAATVTLRVYDVLGREVATLARGQRRAGRHRVRFETERLSSGVYFGRLEVDGQTRTQKITVVQ